MLKKLLVNYSLIAYFIGAHQLRSVWKLLFTNI